MNIQTEVRLLAKMTVQLVQFGVGELAGTWSTTARTGPTVRKRFTEGRMQRLQGQLQRRAANYRHMVHHSSIVWRPLRVTYEGWDGASVSST